MRRFFGNENDVHIVKKDKLRASKCRIYIEDIDITKMDTDAIVNAANEYLQEGGGVCGAIFKKAGRSGLAKACNNIGHCDTGSAVITPAFNLESKFIIHAVGPRYIDGNHGESEMLYNTYQNSMKLAKENGCESITFPLISSGIFGYPIEAAWHVAIRAIIDYHNDNPDTDITVHFAVLDMKIMSIGKKILVEECTE